jgi:hydrogenase expression/formation protein HypD
VKYLDEYRDACLVRRTAAEIGRIATRPWVVMEICGGQTHTIMRYGLDTLLPPSLEIVHGPGCPVCVTALETVDKAIEIASRPDVIFVSYGDMLRVPGSEADLFTVRARGGDVRVVYSPLEALRLARANPDKNVVFFAIGFETTAPAHALTVHEAKHTGVTNFSVLVSHVRVPPAIRGLLSSPGNRVQGFIAPGHVCAVMGYREYEDLSREYRVPIVVGGFEPLDILEATRMLVAQLEAGLAETENQYSRSVTRAGIEPAQRMVEEVFEVSDRPWRGLGIIPHGGLRLREAYSAWDAERLFDVADRHTPEPPECISAQVLQGLKKPTDCTAFGSRCKPESPLGAPMVSNEGACAAYYRYKRPQVEVTRCQA